MGMGLGSNIRWLRTQRGMTLERLAELSDVDVGTISALEVRGSARSKYAPALARALGVTLEDLLGPDLPLQVAPPTHLPPRPAQEATPAYRVEASHAEATLSALARLLETLPEDARPEVRRRLGELVDHPDSVVGLRRLAALLEPASAAGLQQTLSAALAAPQSTASSSAEKSPRRGNRLA